ncbi:MAG TPA: ABC-type transport auxiliary lipoprotein family protein [Saliniramus sp.]|nr:ABC-type transport auxiliary lipoprotein family protein [Saliniramus sp.]
MTLAAVLSGAVALAGCAGSPAALTTFSLTAPDQAVTAPIRLPGLLLIAVPTGIQLFSTDRIVVRDAGGSLSYLPGVQWADQLPALIQSRMVATFENTSRLGSVSRPGDRVTPDFQLNFEIRRFEIDATTGEAVVELSVRAVNEANGQIAQARVFRAAVPVTAIEGGAAGAGLDLALSEVMLDIVRWTGSRGGAQAVS